MDFGFGRTDSVDTTDATTKVDNDKENIDNNSVLINPDDKTNIDNNNVEKDVNNKIEENKNNEESNKNISFSHGLDKNTSIEIDNIFYTVNEHGDLIDKDGQIFKKENEVKEWLEEYNSAETNDDELNIDAIKKVFDINFTDEDGNEIEFENNIQGIKAYVDSIIETNIEDAKEAAINSLYEKIPILKDLIPYYIANGNSLDGFNESIPDYSNVEINENDEAQQIEIIRTAWNEQGRKGDFNKYVNFLKADGTLADVAREELTALKELAEDYRIEMAKKAEEREKADIEQKINYWKGVKEVIDSRNIAGYKIPETIIINKNGQKVSYTPNDFFNYIYQVDEHGHSRYEYDRAAETPEDRRNDEILRAYLKFTGGNYSNLIDMAINNEQIRKLRLTSKTRKQAVTIKINKPSSTKNNTNFGY